MHPRLVEQLLRVRRNAAVPEQRALVSSYKLSDAEHPQHKSDADYVRNRSIVPTRWKREPQGNSRIRHLAAAARVFAELVRRNPSSAAENGSKAPAREQILSRTELQDGDFQGLPNLTEEDIDDLDDAPDDEVEQTEETVVDQATGGAARSLNSRRKSRSWLASRRLARVRAVVLTKSGRSCPSASTTEPRRDVRCSWPPPQDGHLQRAHPTRTTLTADRAAPRAPRRFPRPRHSPCGGHGRRRAKKCSGSIYAGKDVLILHARQRRQGGH